MFKGIDEYGTWLGEKVESPNSVEWGMGVFGMLSLIVACVSILAALALGLVSGGIFLGTHLFTFMSWFRFWCVMPFVLLLGLIYPYTVYRRELKQKRADKNNRESDLKY